MESGYKLLRLPRGAASKLIIWLHSFYMTAPHIQIVFIVKTTNSDPLIDSPISELLVESPPDAALLGSLGIKIDQPRMARMDSRLIHGLWTGCQASPIALQNCIVNTLSALGVWGRLRVEGDPEEEAPEGGQQWVHRGLPGTQQRARLQIQALCLSLRSISCDSTRQLLWWL